MKTEDVPMFDVETPAVTTPKRERKGNGRPRWSRYNAKSLMKCDDCMLVLALAKGEAPVSRYAHFRRKQDDSDLLLCYGHAAIRREEDGLEELR